MNCKWNEIFDFRIMESESSDMNYWRQTITEAYNVG